MTGMDGYDPRNVARQLAEAAVWRALSAASRQRRAPRPSDVEHVMDAVDAYAAEVGHAAPSGLVEHDIREPDLYPLIALLAGLLESAGATGRTPRPRRVRTGSLPGNVTPIRRTA